MKKKYSLLLAAALASLGQSHAQSVDNTLPLPTIEQFTTVSYPQDSAASVIILCDQSVTQYTDLLHISYDRKVRVKVLKAEGLSQLDTSAISNVYALDDGQIKASANTQPKAGDIIDLTYHHESSDYKHIEPWCPQGELPVLSSHYTLITPADYTISIERLGDCGLRTYSTDTIDFTSLNGTSYKACRHEYDTRYISALPKDEWLYCPSDFRFRLSPYVDKIVDAEGKAERVGLTWEQVDAELLKTELYQRFQTPDNPMGRMVKTLRDEGKTVLPVFLRSRSKGKVNLSHPSVDAFDDIIIAQIQKKDTTFIDPFQTDSMQNLLDVEKRVCFARIINDKDKRITGSWTEMFDVIDYRIIQNENITIDQNAVMTSLKNTYYRNLALLYLKNTIDSVDTRVQLSPTISFDGNGTTYRIAPLSDVCKEITLPDSTRTLPVEYEYSINKRYNLTIDIDDRFEIVEVPESMNYFSSIGPMACSVSIKQVGQRLEIVFVLRRIIMAQLPSCMEYMTSFFNLVHSKCQEEVVLRDRRSS